MHVTGLDSCYIVIHSGKLFSIGMYRYTEKGKVLPYKGTKMILLYAANLCYTQQNQQTFHNVYSREEGM